ncbi:small GTPase superfamily, partial [Blyttiomyces helicus]
VILRGSPGVGKTNLLTRWTQDSFDRFAVPTIGSVVTINTITIDGMKVTGQIWDTGGGQIAERLATTFYSGSYGAILVYDITNRASFSFLDDTYKEVSLWVDPIMIVGNKCDQSGLRVVTREEGQEWYGMQFVETSALESTQVGFMFQTTLAGKKYSIITEAEGKLDAGVNAQSCLFWIDILEP